MNRRVPLSALLSKAIVAFTIEFDNEAEHQLRHRTTRHDSEPGSRDAPWLVSLVMWLNCLRFVTDEGITVRELQRLARTRTNLNGMVRWGYISVKPNPADTRPKPPRSSRLIRPTRAGRESQAVLQPLLGVIESRWKQRFGARSIDRLRKALLRIVERLDPSLPDCLPILQYGLYSSERNDKQPNSSGIAPDTASSFPLLSLLSKVLLAFAIEFEGESEVSLAISANVLRLVGAEGIPVRDLPHTAGVSKEAIAMALSFLVKRGYAIVGEQPPGSRMKVVLLTPKGVAARNAYSKLLPAMEERWHARFGEPAVTALRNALERIVCPPAGHGSSLFDGLVPYPDGWRASVPSLRELPHYPMVLHRGGFPDGS